MVTANQIEQAFGRALEAAPAIAPIVWPNRTKTLPAKPYLVVQHVPTTRRSVGMAAGAGQVVSGVFVVTVVTDINTFSTEANTLAAQVMARFPRATRISAGSGKLQFGPNDANELTPSRDGPDWRQPVRVSYQVTGR
jgi:hypothetical protein